MKRISLIAFALLVACGGGGSAFAPSTPSTQPSATPSNSPVTPQATVTALTFQSGGAQSFSVTENAYTGAYNEADTCNPYSGSIAKVTVSSSAPGTVSYSVLPVAAGICNITVSDAAGHNVSISVSVASANITVQ